jgi:hypothetical protein
VTPSEVSALLLAVAAVDDRVSHDDARVQAWHAILDDRTSLDHARDAVVEHYRRETRVIMPADVNTYAKSRRDREREESERLALEAGPRGVPMPPEIRAQLDRMLGRKP